MNEFIPITNGEVQDLYAGRNNKHMYMVKTYIHIQLVKETHQIGSISSNRLDDIVNAHVFKDIKL